MLFITCKRAAIFQEDTYEVNPVTKETIQIVTAQVTVYPTNLNPDGDVPVEVPDWAQDDELFQIGVRDGWVIVVSEQSARAAQARVANQQPGEVVKVGAGLPTGKGVVAWKKG